MEPMNQAVECMNLFLCYRTKTDDHDKLDPQSLGIVDQSDGSDDENTGAEDDKGDMEF